jgi:phosphotransferase system IIB component
MSREIKSAAKRRVIEFIRHTRHAKTTVPFVFTLEGTENDARAFVHRMRVELSRLRQRVKDRGKVPVPFKMMLGDIKTLTPNKQQISLVKDNSIMRVSKEVDEVFDDLAGGELLSKSGD